MIRRRFGLADALRLRFAGEAGFVPGRPLVCCCVVGVDAERRTERRELWLLPRAGDGAPRPVGGARCASPRDARPSPDGARLAFTADVDGVAQLCCASMDDPAGAEPLTDLPQGVAGAPAWSPDGGTIAFAAPPAPRRDPSAPYRVDRHTIRFDGIGIVDDALLDLFALDVATRAVRRLTGDRAIDEEPRFSPDGARLLFRRSFAPDRAWTAKPSLHVLDLASGERRALVEEWGGAFAAEWCPGGRRIAFCGVRAQPGVPDAYMRRRDLWTIDLAGGEPVCRTAGLRAGAGSWLGYDQPAKPADDVRIRVDATGATAYVGAQRGRDAGIVRVALDGAEDVEAVVAPAGRAVFLRDLDPRDGALLSAGSSPTEPPELLLHEDGRERRLTRLNDGLADELVRPAWRPLEIIAPDGLRLEGGALTPPGEGPFPTILCIHGGPGSAYGSPFMIDWQLLTGAGFAVVFSNFRGSGGYGDDFHAALGDRWGELGEPDHLATVDRAIELGIADPERLGLYGLSHGGFATCWLAGRTDRFRAGVAENPLVDFASAAATVDAPWWVPRVMGAMPAEDPAGYAARSPLTYAERCTTPLLFVVGERDERCHPTEAEQFHRVLRSTGCPTEMLRLPGAGHVGSWQGPVPVRAAQDAALLDWFRRHLLAPGVLGSPARRQGGKDTSAWGGRGAVVGARER